MKFREWIDFKRKLRVKKRDDLKEKGFVRGKWYNKWRNMIRRGGIIWWEILLELQIELP